MTGPEIKFDPELAWDIQEWAAPIEFGEDGLTRGHIKNLANYLGEKGYTKGKPAGGLGSLLSTLEDAGAKLVDEFGPLIDGLRKPK